MKVVTFRVGEDTFKKLKNVVKTNRRWKDVSEIIRQLCILYTEDVQVREVVHARLVVRYGDLMTKDDL